MAAIDTDNSDGESHPATGHGTCLNCGTTLIGEYCHACGQSGHVHTSLAAFWHDVSHGVLHVEGKIWHTLPLLAWRPGQLTRRYIDGERTRFLSPMALFLFSVFLMFAVFSTLGGGVHVDPQVSQGINEELVQTEAQIAAMERERAALAARGEPTVAIDARIRSARESSSLLRTISSRGFVEGVAVRVSDDVPAWMRHAIEKVRENPSLMLYKIKANAYKFSWLLIPISIPFVWLMFFWRRDLNFYDHAVFVTYSLAFMSLLLIAAAILGAIGVPGGLLVLAVIVIAPWHMYRQLKQAYRLSRAGALVRTWLLLFVSIVALVVFLMVLITIGALG